MFFEKERNSELSYRKQYEELNEDSAFDTGLSIGHAKSYFQERVKNNESDVSFKVICYESKTYAQRIDSDLYRVTTSDSVTYTHPSFKYHTVTHDELRREDYNNLFADKIPCAINQRGCIYALVFYDMEIGGSKLHDDILQISMKSGTHKFNCNVDPTQPVTKELVKFLPRQIVYVKLLHFLKSLGYKCIMVAHDSSGSNMPHRLLRAIDNVGLLEEYSQMIVGFTDTFELLKYRYPNNEDIQYELPALVQHFFQQSLRKPTCAKQNVEWLENLTNGKLNACDIVSFMKPLEASLHNVRKSETTQEVMRTYVPMNHFISCYTRQILARAKISYHHLVFTYLHLGEGATLALLKREGSGGEPLIQNVDVIDDILNYLKSIRLPYNRRNIHLY